MYLTDVINAFDQLYVSVKDVTVPERTVLTKFQEVIAPFYKQLAQRVGIFAKKMDALPLPQESIIPAKAAQFPPQVALERLVIEEEALFHDAHRTMLAMMESVYKRCFHPGGDVDSPNKPVIKDLEL